MSHRTTTFPKLSFKASWKVGTTWLAEEILDGQRQRLDIPAHAMPELLTSAFCKKKKRERLGRGSQLNRPSYISDDTMCHGTELNINFLCLSVCLSLNPTLVLFLNSNSNICL